MSNYNETIISFDEEDKYIDIVKGEYLDFDNFILFIDEDKLMLVDKEILEKEDISKYIEEIITKYEKENNYFEEVSSYDYWKKHRLFKKNNTLIILHKYYMLSFELVYDKDFVQKIILKKPLFEEYSKYSEGLKINTYSPEGLFSYSLTHEHYTHIEKGENSRYIVLFTTNKFIYLYDLEAEKEDFFSNMIKLTFEKLLRDVKIECNLFVSNEKKKLNNKMKELDKTILEFKNKASVFEDDSSSFEEGLAKFENLRDKLQKEFEDLNNKEFKEENFEIKSIFLDNNYGNNIFIILNYNKYADLIIYNLEEDCIVGTYKGDIHHICYIDNKNIILGIKDKDCINRYIKNYQYNYDGNIGDIKNIHDVDNSSDYWVIPEDFYKNNKLYYFKTIEEDDKKFYELFSLNIVTNVKKHIMYIPTKPRDVFIKNDLLYYKTYIFGKTTYRKIDLNYCIDMFI